VIYGMQFIGKSLKTGEEAARKSKLQERLLKNM
jgi:hypothetical protein